MGNNLPFLVPTLLLRPRSKEESSLPGTALSCFTPATAEKSGQERAQDSTDGSEGQARGCRWPLQGEDLGFQASRLGLECQGCPPSARAGVPPVGSGFC